MAGPLRPERVARTYVLACTAAAVCGIATAVLTAEHRVAGPVERPGDLAFFLVVALPLVGTVRRPHDQPMWSRGQSAEKTRGPSWPVHLSVAVLAVGLLGTGSLGGYAGAGVVLVLAAATRLLGTGLTAALLGLAALGMALVVTVLPRPVGDALADPQRYAEATLSQRADLWQSAADMTAASPVLGLGPGAFALWYDGPGLDDSAASSGSAHSTPLEAAADLGLLGAVALYLAWTWPAVAALRRRRRSTFATALVVAAEGGLAVSLFESEQHRLPLWLLAATLLAVAAAGRARTR
jgi:putative inorganic carbon (hco3(-)) transporter